jgi:hypothetical protein
LSLIVLYDKKQINTAGCCPATNYFLLLRQINVPHDRKIGEPILDCNCQLKYNQITLKLPTAAIVTESFTSSIDHTEEIAAMNKSVDELHNREDATSLMDGLKFFFGVLLLLGVLGIIFWSAF